METTTQTKNAAHSTTRQPKKLSVERLKLEAGDKFEGVLIGKSTVPWTDRKTGEVKDLTRLHFRNGKDVVVLINEDAGLASAMADAMVKEGQRILIEKLEKEEIGGGRSVNRYDIYGFDN